MFRTLTVSLLAATLALTAPMAEASDRRMSQQDRTAAAVLGLLTLGIIAHAANQEQERKDDRKKAKRAAERERERAAERERLRREETARVPVIRGERGGFGHSGVSVPASCARRVQTEAGRDRTAFGAPCLRRAGVDVARLPDRCERRLDIGRGEIPAWGARCLDRAGVRIR